MPLISSLKTSELKDLLRERELVATGNKAELFKRLTEFEGSEEIEFDNINSNENVREQIDELRNMIESVVSMVQQSFRNPQTSNASNNERQNRDLPLPNQEHHKRNSYSIREIADTLPEYDPTKDLTFSVNQFIDRVEKSLQAYEWDEKCLMLAIYTKLKGPAKLWLGASADLYVSWREFANALKEEFESVSDEADIHFRMSNATREDGESINEYCFRMNALGKRHHLNDSSIIKYTREGLKHRELQTSIATIRFKTMKEMRETLDEYFMNMPSCSANARQFVTRKRDEFFPSKTFTKIENTSKTVVERKPVVCFNCSEIGHISSACPKPQKRPRCKDCQRVHPRGTPENCGKPNDRSCNNVKILSTDKKITVNGTEMRALIDTGSECSMISKSKTNQITGIRKLCNVRISGVCGGTRVLSEMISVKLGIDDVEIPADLYVAADDVFSSDVIIGNDIFLANNVRLIGNNNEQRFEYVNVSENEIKSQMRYEITDIKHDEIDELTRSDLYELINGYCDAFGSELNKIGLTNGFEMKIKLTTNKPILQQHPSFTNKNIFNNNQGQNQHPSRIQNQRQQEKQHSLQHVVATVSATTTKFNQNAINFKYNTTKSLNSQRQLIIDNQPHHVQQQQELQKYADALRQESYEEIQVPVTASPRITKTNINEVNLLVPIKSQDEHGYGIKTKMKKDDQTVCNNYDYVIKPGNSSRTKQPNKSVYAAHKMKPCYNFPEIEDDEPKNDDEGANRGRLLYRMADCKVTYGDGYETKDSLAAITERVRRPTRNE